MQKSRIHSDGLTLHSVAAPDCKVAWAPLPPCDPVFFIQQFSSLTVSICVNNYGHTMSNQQDQNINTGPNHPQTWFFITKVTKASLLDLTHFNTLQRPERFCLEGISSHWAGTKGASWKAASGICKSEASAWITWITKVYIYI